MTIQNRLDLFVSSSMIEREDAQKIQTICLIYTKEFGLDVEIEASERFITHFAGMYMRMKEKQVIEPISSFVMEQLITDPYFQNANVLLSRLVKEVTIPSEEEGYFLLHLIHFLGQQNECQSSC